MLIFITDNMLPSLSPKVNEILLDSPRRGRYSTSASYSIAKADKGIALVEDGTDSITGSVYDVPVYDLRYIDNHFKTITGAGRQELSIPGYKGIESYVLPAGALALDNVCVLKNKSVDESDIFGTLYEQDKDNHVISTGM